VEVDGCPIHFRVWGDEELPVLVLVHGGGAHSGWWDHIAPLLTGRHRVVALDLSGHGDSGRRTTYTAQSWAREVITVADAVGPGGRPVAHGQPPMIVGHSMGGRVTASVGVWHGERLGGIVIIDSPLNDRPPEEELLRRRRRPAKVYATREEAIAHFVTTPRQDVLLPYVRRHIAEESLRRTDGGWTWKFDPTLFGRLRVVLLRDMLPELRCRATFIRSQFGLVPAAMAGEIDALLGYRTPIVELPDAGHHPMFDQPLPLVTALRLLVTQWVLSTPEVS